MTFSEDGRWLVSASMDCRVKVWDIPGAQMLHSMRVEVPPTAVSLTPHCEMLATTHSDHRGIYLWYDIIDRGLV